MAVLRVVIAIFIRNWLSMLSYRFALGLRYLGMFINLVVLFFVFGLFKEFKAPANVLTEADGNWIAYVITGGLAMTILGTCMKAFVSDIRNGQMLGTLEAILSSPMSITRLLSASWLYNVATVFVRLGVSIGILIWLIDLQPSMMSPLVMIAAFLSMVVAFSPLGILSAAFTLAYKKGDPVALFIGSTFVLFGGVIFPPHRLPDVLEPFSNFLPITYATQLTRKSMLTAAEWSQVTTEITVLLCFGLALFPISVLTFRWGLNKARRDASLAMY